MRKICKERLHLERTEKPRQEAIAYMQAQDEPYKVELIQDLPEDAVISFYTQGEFTDLCAGPHLDSTAGSRATHPPDPVLRRLLAGGFQAKCFSGSTAWPSKKEELRSTCAARRKPAAGTTTSWAGSWNFHHRGRNRPGPAISAAQGRQGDSNPPALGGDEEEKRGYLLTKTPYMAKRELYKISGHWDHYLDACSSWGTPHDETKECFALRPMTCPFQYQVFLNRARSYRDLPMRLGETSTLSATRTPEKCTA